MCTGTCMSCTCILPVHILHVPHLPTMVQVVYTSRTRGTRSIYIYYNTSTLTKFTKK
jgi:hypothetical protein